MGDLVPWVIWTIDVFYIILLEVSMMARIRISLPKDFLEMVDAAAKIERRSRSQLIREAVRGCIDKKSGGSRPLLDNKEVKWAVKIQDQSRRELKNLKVNTTEIVRKFRGRT